MPNGKPNILILWGDEHLPTHHGFDEFFGNLYHLNAEEEPKLLDDTKEDDPEFPSASRLKGLCTLSER